MNLLPALVLGFLLGMRHATDADHVVAVSTMVSRTRSVRAAAPVGVLWGVGHTLTILCVGGAIVAFGLVIPPRVGLSLELCVAGMLLVLGAMSLREAFVGLAEQRETTAPPRIRWRSLLMGTVHGLAGSAAVALLVLSTIHHVGWALAYLAVFGVGTVAGMLLITAAFAVPIAVTAGRFQRMHRLIGVVSGLASLAIGVFLAYRIGFVDGIFGASPSWSPQ